MILLMIFAFVILAVTLILFVGPCLTLQTSQLEHFLFIKPTITHLAQNVLQLSPFLLVSLNTV